MPSPPTFNGSFYYFKGGGPLLCHFMNPPKARTGDDSREVFLLIFNTFTANALYGTPVGFLGIYYRAVAGYGRVDGSPKCTKTIHEIPRVGHHTAE